MRMDPEQAKSRDTEMESGMGRLLQAGVVLAGAVMIAPLETCSVAIAPPSPPRFVRSAR